MTIRKFRAGRVANATASSWVGERGTIFYDEATGQLKLSDGTTPGGSFIPMVIATASTAGAIKASPGVIISADGTLVIDSSGLTFNFGNLIATGGNISTINPNEDLNIVSNGTGVVNIIGDLHVHKTAANANVALAATPVFSVDRTGVTTILVPTTVTTTGGVEIIGNPDGTFQSPVNTGVMLHITGNEPDGVATPSRLYNDAIAGYSGFVGRRYNGTSTVPTAVQANDEVTRLAANAYKSDGWAAVGGSNIRFIATDNQTNTAQGMKIDFYSTPKGTATSGIVKVLSLDGGFGANVIGQVTATANVTTAANVNASAVYADLHGKLFRPVRDAGTIADAGTLTIDFSADSIVHCVWGNGMTLAYQNYTAGRIVKLVATKSPGTGNDVLNLDGLTAAQVSSGSTTQSYNADVTAFVELICTGTTIGSVYAKL